MTVPAGARPVSTTGPKWMTFIGVGLLALALVAAVVTVVAFVRVLPFGVVKSDGTPGDDVVLALDVGQTGQVSLDADTLYTIWAVTDGRLIPDPPSVTGLDGDDVKVATSSVSSSASSGRYEAVARWEFTTDGAGTYTVTAQPVIVNGTYGMFAVTEGTSVGSLVGGVGVTVVGMIVAIGSGLVGLPMAIGGGIWWGSRRKQRRVQEAGSAFYQGGPPAYQRGGVPYQGQDYRGQSGPYG